MSAKESIPAASLPLVKGIPIDSAVEVGQHLRDRFHAWDQTPKGSVDPSLCKGLYQLPGGALFWQSKMAIDADGSPTASVLASSSGSNKKTSLQFSKPVKAINPEIVPYFVLPQGEFDDAFGIKLGTLGVVIYKDKITGAIFADAGPAHKIGEASIRVHELIVGPKSPWKGNPADKIIRDASIEKGVVYFVFPHAQFDIEAYKPGTLAKQREMAAAIHTAAMAEFERLKQPALAAVNEAAFDGGAVGQAASAMEIPVADTASAAPAGWAIVIQRLREELRAGKGYKRTVGTYQVYHDGVAQPNLFGMTVELHGPGDNSETGKSSDRRKARCVEAGTYRINTQDGDLYTTVGYKTDNVHTPRPGIELYRGDTGKRSEILIHPCHDNDGYVSSIGCINLAGQLVDATSKVSYSDSIKRVIAVIDDLKAFNGGTLPKAEELLAKCHAVIREPAAQHAFAGLETDHWLLAANVTTGHDTDYFAFASSEWNQLATELNTLYGWTIGPFSGGAKETRYATAVVTKLLAERGGPKLMIGFDANCIEPYDGSCDPDYDGHSLEPDEKIAQLAGPLKLVQSPGTGKQAKLAIYVEGPGGATGNDWSIDEALRAIKAAEAVVKAAPSDASLAKLAGVLSHIKLKSWQQRAFADKSDGKETFKAYINDKSKPFMKDFLPVWRGGGGAIGPWWQATKAQLDQYHDQGFFAAEIDNLAGLFDPDDENRDNEALLEFIKTEYLPYRAHLPKLILKNVPKAALDAIKAQFTSDEITVFADFHIFEISKDRKLADKKQIAKDIRKSTMELGRRALFSFDTDHYHVAGPLAGNQPRPESADWLDQIPFPVAAPLAVHYAEEPASSGSGDSQSAASAMEESPPFVGGMADEGEEIYGDDRYRLASARGAAVAPIDRAALAQRIGGSVRIKLADFHVSGVADHATVRHNIEDTAAGRPAQRSHYGNAPGGTVMLDPRLLSGLLALAEHFTFSISELCGGSHNETSRHYAGIAADITVINGHAVQAGHPDLAAFMQLCRSLGAQEVLGPGNRYHDNHVHAAWPRP